MMQMQNGRKPIVIVVILFISSWFGICQLAFAQTEPTSSGNLEALFMLSKEPNSDVAELRKLPRGRLTIDSQSRGITDVVMWLDVANQPDLKRIPVTPEMQRHEIVAEEDSWKPRIVTAMVGDEVFYDESKSLRPHVITGINNVGSAAAKDRVYRYRLLQEGQFPSRYYCSIERELEGHVLTLSHRWVGVSRPSGVLKIEAIPSGSWDFRLWHERCGWIEEVQVNGMSAHLRRGKLKLEVKPNCISRYEILIPHEQFLITSSKSQPEDDR